MKTTRLSIGGLLVARISSSAVVTPAVAQECQVQAPDAYEMTDEQIRALYDCLEGLMLDGYTQGENPVAADYRSWTVTGTRPGPDPSHGDRLLLTFANETASDQYLEFAAEGVEMPIGAILAKESIAIRDGQGEVGPLFIMEKVGLEAAPETDGWLYSGVQPDGTAMGFPQSFCHDCHVAFEGQDALAYPAPELRTGQ